MIFVSGGLSSGFYPIVAMRSGRAADGRASLSRRAAQEVACQRVGACPRPRQWGRWWRSPLWKLVANSMYDEHLPPVLSLVISETDAVAENVISLLWMM